MASKRWFGIDFSGDHLKWRPGCTRGNVYVAEIIMTPGSLELVDLKTVQDLPGEGHPFDRLVRLLGEDDYAAAAIDAPFSVPKRCSSSRSYKALLEKVAKAANVCEERPFPIAKAFVEAVVGKCPPLDPPKPLRATEEVWREQKVNVRSTLWAGPRGGAAMTAACMMLLARSQRPIWPFERTGSGLLAEAFPAAQLRQWKLPYQGYNGTKESPKMVRREILAGLKKRVDLGKHKSLLLDSADALDAVVCALAAVAVTEGAALAPAPLPDIVDFEGWIAVHK